MDCSSKNKNIAATSEEFRFHVIHPCWNCFVFRAITVILIAGAQILTRYCDFINLFIYGDHLSLTEHNRENERRCFLRERERGFGRNAAAIIEGGSGSREK